MARTTTVLRLFVASPGDLMDERALVPDVCAELNRTFEHAGIQVEPVMWETHGRPGVGADPQEVLNEQLPDDCDIFLGLLWSRFGTPTNRAESGTAEEFNRALRRFDEDPKGTRVLTYFKDTAIEPVEDRSRPA